MNNAGALVLVHCAPAGPSPKGHHQSTDHQDLYQAVVYAESEATSQMVDAGGFHHVDSEGRGDSVDVHGAPRGVALSTPLESE